MELRAVDRAFRVETGAAEPPSASESPVESPKFRRLPGLVDRVGPTNLNCGTGPFIQQNLEQFDVVSRWFAMK